MHTYSAEPVLPALPAADKPTLKFYGVLTIITYWTVNFVLQVLILQDVSRRFPPHGDPAIVSLAAHATLAVALLMQIALFAAAWASALLALRFAGERTNPGELFGAFGLAHLPLAVFGLLAAFWFWSSATGPVPDLLGPDASRVHEYLCTGRFLVFKRAQLGLQVITFFGAVETAHRTLETPRKPLLLSLGLMAVLVILLNSLS